MTRKRPGGLTALAVFNFIFAFLNLLSVAGMFAFMALADRIREDLSEEEREVFDALQELGTGAFAAIIGITVFYIVLLAVSGFGYLKLKKFLGRTLGNTYAVVSIVAAIVSGMMLPPELGGGFGLYSILGLIYPLLTLYLLNVQFKEDFEAA